MTIVTKKDNKTAILDAAESLMAGHGINGVSLRAILVEAGANSAALHYHFNGREGLIAAILARRGRQLNLRRREVLDALASEDRVPHVYDVVDAVLDPLLEMLREDGEAGRRFLRFLARLQSDRSEILQTEEKHYFPDVHERIARMLTQACPHVPAAERVRRVTMMIDAMLQSLANAEVMAEEWTGGAHVDALAEFADSLKNFLAGGLSAPVR